LVEKKIRHLGVGGGGGAPPTIPVPSKKKPAAIGRGFFDICSAVPAILTNLQSSVAFSLLPLELIKDRLEYVHCAHQS